MYQKYQTEAIVMGSRQDGEANRMYTLYTSEFGVVRARATGVRLEKSKMRYALQSYAHCHIGLVRGKAVWRIAGASSVCGVSGASLDATRAFARLCVLVERLVVREEQNPALFAILTAAHKALFAEHSVDWATVELLSAAHILHALGYLSSEAVGSALFAQTLLAPAHLAEVASRREKLLKSVNQAIAETQL